MEKKEITRISGSLSDIYPKILSIAEHHFNYKDGDVDFLKSGFMGWSTECMALMLRNSAIQKSMLYNEGYLNTAIIPKSIYNWAKMFNIDVTKATPASADIMITINTSDLDTMISKRRSSDVSMAKYGSDVSSLNNKNIFVIDRSNQIISGDFAFAIENSIIIYKNNAGNYIVKTCSTEDTETTSFGDDKGKILKTVITSNEKSKYLSFIIHAYQYKINSYEKQITSSSFTETRTHVFEFTEQLAGLRLRYKKNNKIENIKLEFSNDISDPNHKYGYYNIIDEGKIQIKFSDSNFIPSVGGTLLLDIYTTKGSGGNVNFTGDAVLQLSDEDYRSLAISATFTNYQANGGVDAPTLNQIKSNIINEISTRDVIVTDADLNKYFDDLKLMFGTINDGKIEFIKKRADVIKRIFNAYVLLRDGMSADGETMAASGYRSKVIPTNTVDVTFPITNNMSKPFGTLVEENITGNKVTYNYIPSELSEDKNYYLIPFYLRVMLSPVKKVKYLYNLTSDSSSLTYNNIERSGKYTISPSSVSIVRGTEGLNMSNRYTFTFTFATDFNLADIWGDNTVDLLLYKSKNIAHTITVKLNDAPDDNQFGFKIISDSSDDSGIYTTYFIISVPVAEEEFIFSNLDDYGTFINLISNSGTVKLPEDIYVGLDIEANLQDSSISMSFKSENKLALFRNLDTIMNSDIVLNKKTEIEKDVTDFVGKEVEKITSVTLKEVPVIHTSFFNNEVNQTKFIKQLFTYIDMLKRNMSKLETNTGFNLKFMNTYGYSQRYNSINTNLNLQMTVWLNSDNGMEQEIRDYIRVLIDKANEDHSLKISQVIALTTTAYNKYIHHIDFEGLNGTFEQYINQVESNSIVPEYFNLDSGKLNNIKFKLI